MIQGLATLIGRLLLASIFIISAITKIGNHDATVARMAEAGIPAAAFFIYAAVLVELAGGLSILTGFRARIGALLLFAFLIPVTYLFHLRPAFDAAMNVVDRAQMTNTLKNLAIMGGLLLIYGNGAGKMTLGKDS
jgi:putative oxidoreductase